MADTVTIRIGGLVVFSQVKTATDEGLYVFFLSAPQHMAHVPVFTPEAELRPRKDITFGEIVDLRPQLGESHNKATLPNLIRTRKITNKTIDAKYYSTTNKHDLAATLILPLPAADPTVPGRMMTVRKKGSLPTEGEITGWLEFEYTWKKSTFTVLKEAIQPGAVMEFENASHKRPPRRAPQGYRLDHPELLLRWLDPGTSVQLELATDFKALFGGSPVQCASGGGCPDPAVDPNCGDG